MPVKIGETKRLYRMKYIDKVRWCEVRAQQRAYCRCLISAICERAG